MRKEQFTMMKILTPTGSLIEVAKVEPIVEERVQFNGSEVRLCQVAKDSKQNITGLYITSEADDSVFCASTSILVANLKPSLAEEIMQKLLSDGYYDFSALDYQAKPAGIKDYVYNAGASKPYHLEGLLLNACSPASSFDFPVRGLTYNEPGVDDDLEDIRGMSDEVLRATIYELEDIPMKTLADMSREELEAEYLDIKVGDCNE